MKNGASLTKRNSAGNYPVDDAQASSQKELEKIRKLLFVHDLFSLVDKGDVKNLQLEIQKVKFKKLLKLTDENGASILQFAVLKGNVEIVQCILQFGFPVDENTIYMAIKNSKFNIVQVF